MPDDVLQELEASREEEMSHLRQTILDIEHTAASHEAHAQIEVRQLERQIAELREIVDAGMHTKRASTLKLETAMNALNLSKTDAKRFIEVQFQLLTCTQHTWYMSNKALHLEFVT